MIQDTALVIGGAGAVGRLFCELLLKGYQHVVAMDLRSDSDSQIEGVVYVQGDANKPKSIELLQQSKLILLTIPEDPAIEFIQSSGHLLKPGQCLIDTMSVKTSIVEHLLKLNPGFEVLSINPMFGPALGFQGQSVACVNVNVGPIAQHFLSLIRDAGSTVVEVSAEEHDRYTAITQAATHAAILSFGMALEKMNYISDSAKPIWTPPHKTLLALLARILAADPEVYRDIQVSNPYAEEARQAMMDSLVALESIVSSGRPEKFRELFELLKPVLGTSEAELAELSQDIFINL